MAEEDLSPTTFTSRSASDPDYDISTDDSSENENENTYTEASSDNSSSDPETESNADWSPQEFDDAKAKAKADLNWIKLSSPRTDQITENNLQEMAAWLFAAVFVKAKKQRALNTDWEKNCYCHHELKIIHHEKLLRLIISDSHSSTFSDLINQWLLWKLCYRFKEKDRDKKNKKAAFTVAWMKFLLNFQAQKTTQERTTVERFSSSAPSTTTGTVHAVISEVCFNVKNILPSKIKRCFI